MTKRFVKGAHRSRSDRTWRVRLLAGGVAFGALAAASSAWAGSVVLSEEQFNAIMERNRALEGRVEQLEGQVQDNGQNLQIIQGQQQRVNEQIDAVKDEIPDERKLTHSGKSGVKLTLSGQVNRAVMFTDVGEEDGNDEGRNVFVVDNDNSSSRFKLKGVAPLGDGHEFGAQIEMEVQSNPSNEVESTDDGDVGPGGGSGDVTFEERKIEAWYKNPWFTFWIGQGSMASDGTAESDLSGTAIVGSSDIDDIGSDINFRLPTGAQSAFDVDEFFNNFDGLGRRDRVRLDSPKWHGTQVSTSYANGGDYDIAVHHSYKWPVLGGLKVKAGGSYYWNGGTGSPTGHFEGIAVSASALHEESGLNFTASYGERWFENVSADPNDDRDGYYIYLKGGLFRQFFDIGKTAVALEYYHSQDLTGVDREGHMYGGAIVQYIDETATEIYGGVRLLEAEIDGGPELEDMLIGIVGIRQKF